MNLIVFTGFPASGKSSLSKAVSKSLKIKTLSFDDLKVAIFEKKGFKNSLEKKNLAKISEKLFYEKIKEYCLRNENLIIDKFYTKCDTLKETIKDFDNVNLICINLIVDYDIAVNRFNERSLSQQRHLSLISKETYPVSDEDDIVYDLLTVEILKSKTLNRLDKDSFNHVLDIDTNNIKTDFDKIVKRSIDFIQEKLID